MLLKRYIVLAETRIGQSTLSNSLSTNSEVVSVTEAAVNNEAQVQGT